MAVVVVFAPLTGATVVCTPFGVVHTFDVPAGVTREEGEPAAFFIFHFSFIALHLQAAMIRHIDVSVLHMIAVPA